MQATDIPLKVCK